MIRINEFLLISSEVNLDNDEFQCGGFNSEAQRLARRCASELNPPHESEKHFGIAPGTDGLTGQAANIVSGSPPDIPGVEVRYKPHPEGGYDLEARIPLAQLGVERVEVGDRFGFDIQVAVGSPENLNRRHQATWSGTHQNYMNPFQWGEAVAVDQQ